MSENPTSEFHCIVSEESEEERIDKYISGAIDQDLYLIWLEREVKKYNFSIFIISFV